MLLSHTPAVMDGLKRSHRVDLVLAGDTHGTQVYVPGLSPLLARVLYGIRHVGGLYRIRGTWLHVSRGVGTVLVPARLFCPPEVTLLECVGGPPPPGPRRDRRG